MKRAIELGPGDWPSKRPFTHPGLAERDCQILIGLIRDLHASRVDEPQLDSPRRGRDRLITTRSGRNHNGGPVSVVGFFGERNPEGPPEVETAVEEVNAEMVADFDSFPILLGYVSRMLDDGFNFANLVVLAGADGISRWRDLPQHVTAVTDLAPRFYSSVRIYNGELPEGLARAELLKMHVVKFWDYRGRRVWHATRSLNQA